MSQHETDVIDFGAHLYPTVPQSEDNPNKEMDRLLQEWQPDLLFDRFAKAGIDGAVLSQPYYMGHHDTEETATANDALLEMVQEHEDLYGLAAVPVAAGSVDAAEEFERALEAGYHGGAVETSSNGIKLADDEFRPIFDVAERYDAPILVHPKLDDSLHPDAFDDRYALNSVFGRESALSASICTVIHKGILDEYTDLNLVYHHLGGNIGAMMGRIKHRLEDGRWPDQEHVKTFADFKDQLEDRIYIDSAGFLGYQDPINTALRQFPDSQVLFGTDSPFGARDVAELNGMRESIERAASKRDANEILGGNALELLANT
jgi:predicted TIM-barrel fold metal-dependent hydrolase